jgi:hypothetical protein
MKLFQIKVSQKNVFINYILIIFINNFYYSFKKKLKGTENDK